MTFRTYTEQQWLNLLASRPQAYTKQAYTRVSHNSIFTQIIYVAPIEEFLISAVKEMLHDKTAY